MLRSCGISWAGKSGPKLTSGILSKKGGFEPALTAVNASDVAPAFGRSQTFRDIRVLRSELVLHSRYSRAAVIEADARFVDAPCCNAAVRSNSSHEQIAPFAESLFFRCV